MRGSRPVSQTRLAASLPAGVLINLLAVLSVGCQGAREALRVEVLGPYFVRVHGERLAIDEFIYRTRLEYRDRSSADPKTGPPPVALSWEDGAVSQRVVRDLIDQLRLAGISEITIGG